MPAHAGFPRALRGAASRSGAGRGSPERAGRVWFLPTDPPRLAAYAARALRGRAAGSRCACGRALAAVRLPEAATPSRSTFDGSPAAERSGVLVDASGDAAAAALAGARVEASPPEELQSPSYIVRLEGVDTRALEPFARLRVSHAVAGAVRARRAPGRRASRCSCARSARRAPRARRSSS